MDKDRREESEEGEIVPAHISNKDTNESTQESTFVPKEATTAGDDHPLRDVATKNEKLASIENGVNQDSPIHDVNPVVIESPSSLRQLRNAYDDLVTHGSGMIENMDADRAEMGAQDLSKKKAGYKAVRDLDLICQVLLEQHKQRQKPGTTIDNLQSEEVDDTATAQEFYFLRWKQRQLKRSKKPLLSLEQKRIIESTRERCQKLFQHLFDDAPTNDVVKSWFDSSTRLYHWKVVADDNDTKENFTESESPSKRLKATIDEDDKIGGDEITHMMELESERDAFPSCNYNCNDDINGGEFKLQNVILAADLDRRGLAEEEEQLIDMALTPIPTASVTM